MRRAIGAAPRTRPRGIARSAVPGFTRPGGRVKPGGLVRSAGVQDARSPRGRNPARRAARPPRALAGPGRSRLLGGVGLGGPADLRRSFAAVARHPGRAQPGSRPPLDVRRHRPHRPRRTPEPKPRGPWPKPRAGTRSPLVPLPRIGRSAAAASASSGAAAAGRELARSVHARRRARRAIMVTRPGAPGARARRLGPGGSRDRGARPPSAPNGSGGAARGARPVDAHPSAGRAAADRRSEASEWGRVSAT